MSKLILQVFLNAYNDSNPSNSPNQNNFKWDRTVNSVLVDNPISNEYTVAPGETRTIWNGIRTLAQDNTTAYTIAQKPLVSGIYVLSAVAGALPNFRTPRSISSNATTQVTVTLNGPLATFTSVAGTNFNFASVQVGDNVSIGSLFSANNQGTYKILAKTATSVTVENELAVAEGPITLASGFATQVRIFSAAGVQVGDKLVISAGFSQVTQGTYDVTAVFANSLEFASAQVLPAESSVTTEVDIYSDAKQFVYLEANQNVDMIINGIDGGNVEPFIVANSKIPGVFMRKATMWSFSVTNNSLDTATIFVASVE